MRDFRRAFQSGILGLSFLGIPALAAESNSTPPNNAPDGSLAPGSSNPRPAPCPPGTSRSTGGSAGSAMSTDPCVPNNAGGAVRDANTGRSGSGTNGAGSNARIVPNRRQGSTGTTTGRPNDGGGADPRSRDMSTGSTGNSRGNQNGSSDSNSTTNAR